MRPSDWWGRSPKEGLVKFRMARNTPSPLLTLPTFGLRPHQLLSQLPEGRENLTPTTCVASRVGSLLVKDRPSHVSFRRQEESQTGKPFAWDLPPSGRALPSPSFQARNDIESFLCGLGLPVVGKLRICHLLLDITYWVTNTLQLPSFSPRSTYFFWISWSRSFWMAAILMPVTSFISANVSVGCVRIAFSILV